MIGMPCGQIVIMILLSCCFLIERWVRNVHCFETAKVHVGESCRKLVQVHV